MLRVRAARPPSSAALRHVKSVRFDAPYHPSTVLPTLANAPHIRSVHLPLPAPSEAPRAAAALRALTYLHTVVVQPYAPPPPFPVGFLTALEGHATLETISLVGCGLHGADAARALTALVEKCGALHGLWLGRNALGAEGGAVLASAASSEVWKRLRHLSLRSCELTDRPALALAYAAPQYWVDLRQLDIRSNALSVQCLTALQTLSSRNPSLSPKLLFDLPPPPPSAPPPPQFPPAPSPPLQSKSASQDKTS